MCDFAPRGRGKSDSARGSIYAGKQAKLAHFPSPDTCWDLLAGMDSVQSPGVPSTGHPGAFFLLSQMPAGVAVFQLQTELKQQSLCLSFVHTESLSKCLHPAKRSCTSRGAVLLIYSKDTNQFRKWKLWLFDAPLCCSHIYCWPVPWPSLSLPLTQGSHYRQTPGGPTSPSLASWEGMLWKPTSVHAQETQRSWRCARAIV